MRSNSAVVLLGLAFAAVACSDDEPPLLGGDVVGSWREMPSLTNSNPPPIADREVITFDGNGMATWEAEFGPAPVPYHTEDGLVVFYYTDAGDPHLFSAPYAVRADRLVFGAFVPVGEVDGLVGTWTCVMADDADTRTYTLAMRSDATATYDVINTDPMFEDFHLEGTWRTVGDDVSALFTSQSFTLEISRVGGILGSPFERI